MIIYSSSHFLCSGIPDLVFLIRVYFRDVLQAAV